MSPSTLSARKPFEAILQAMKGEVLFAPAALEPAALASLFGEHELKSGRDDFKPKVQIHELRFSDGFVLHMSAGPSFRTGKPSVSFTSDRAKGKAGAPLDLSVDDLLRALGQPDSKVDILAQQTAVLSTRGQDKLADTDSPPPLLLRGPTTRPLGNTNLKWRLKTAGTAILIGAEVNGDETLSRVFGDQVME